MKSKQVLRLKSRPRIILLDKEVVDLLESLTVKASMSQKIDMLLTRVISLEKKEIRSEVLPRLFRSNSFKVYLWESSRESHVDRKITSVWMAPEFQEAIKKFKMSYCLEKCGRYNNFWKLVQPTGNVYRNPNMFRFNVSASMNALLFYLLKEMESKNKSVRQRMPSISEKISFRE